MKIQGFILQPQKVVSSPVFGVNIQAIGKYAIYNAEPSSSTVMGNLTEITIGFCIQAMAVSKPPAISQEIKKKQRRLGCACGREAWNGRSCHESLHA